MTDSADPRAALSSLLFPGLGQVLQRRYLQAAAAALYTVALVSASLMLGRVSGRAAEVFFFMVLALPWWALQAYDAYLGPTAAGSSWRRTFRTAWQRGHDIRFLGVLLLISALNDTFIILKNFDYLLPFYCTKFSGIPGFLDESDLPCPPSGRGIWLPTLHPLGVLHLSRLCRLRVYERHGQSRLLWPGSDQKHAPCRRRPLDDVYPLAPGRSAEIIYKIILPSSLVSFSPPASKVGNPERSGALPPTRKQGPVASSGGVGLGAFLTRSFLPRKDGMPRTRLVPRLGHRTAEPMRSCCTTASTVRWSVHAKRQRTELHSRAEAKHRTVELRHRSVRGIPSLQIPTPGGARTVGLVDDGPGSSTGQAVKHDPPPSPHPVLTPTFRLCYL